ncbi:MAG TPA: hypothetical protein VF221_23360 [Chloroflexota bacterium]
METVERIAEAVLYEGYLLFPYTRSTTKNQQRWTFGGVYPRRYSDAGGGNDPWTMQTQCLATGDSRTEIQIKVRFLHILDRTVADDRSGTRRMVNELRVDGQIYRPWEEAVEREVLLGPFAVGELLERSRPIPIDVAAGSEEERLADASGTAVGSLIRSWRALHGEIEFAAEQAQTGCYRLTVTIANTTSLPSSDTVTARGDALRQTMISTHTILRIRDGEFISLLEPPDALAQAVEDCRNLGTWPVLAGEKGDRHTILSSPIILYDYPQIAPESPGNLFDATEIDELLTLSVMTLTDEEKQEMREGDPRGREILERTESLTPEQIISLHGTIRSLQAIRPEEP